MRKGTGSIFALALFVMVCAAPSAVRGAIDLKVKIGADPYRPLDSFGPNEFYFVDGADPGALVMSFAVTHDDNSILGQGEVSPGYLSLYFTGPVDITGCGTSYTTDDYDVPMLGASTANCDFDLAGHLQVPPTACTLTCDSFEFTGDGPIGIEAYFTDENDDYVYLLGQSSKSFSSIVWSAAAAANDFGTFTLTAGDTTVGALTSLTVNVTLPQDVEPYTVFAIVGAIDAGTDLPVAGNKPVLGFSEMGAFAASEYPMRATYRAQSKTVILMYTGDDTILSGTNLEVTLYDVRNPLFLTGTPTSAAHKVVVYHPTDGGIGVGVTTSTPVTAGDLEIVGVSLSDPFIGQYTKLTATVSLPGKLAFKSKGGQLSGMTARVYLPTGVLPYPTAGTTAAPNEPTTLPLGDTAIEGAGGPTGLWVEVALKTTGGGIEDTPSGTTQVAFGYVGAIDDHRFGQVVSAFGPADDITIEIRRPADGVWLTGTAPLAPLVKIYDKKIDLDSVVAQSNVAGTTTEITFTINTGGTGVDIPADAIIHIVMPSTMDDFDYTNVVNAYWDPAAGLMDVEMGDDEVETIAVFEPGVGGNPGMLRMDSVARRVVRLTRTSGAALTQGVHVIKVSSFKHPPVPSRAPNKYAVRIYEADGTPLLSTVDTEFPGMTAIAGELTNPTVSLTSTSLRARDTTVSVSFELTKALDIAMGRSIVFKLTFPNGWDFDHTLDWYADTYKGAVSDPAYQCGIDDNMLYSEEDCEAWGVGDIIEVDPPMLAVFDIDGSNVLRARVRQCVNMECFMGQLNYLPAGQKITFHLYSQVNPGVLGSPGSVGLEIYEDVSAPNEAIDTQTIALYQIDGGVPPAIPAIEAGKLTDVKVFYSTIVTDEDNDVDGAAEGVTVSFHSSVPVQLGAATPAVIKVVFPVGFGIADSNVVANVLVDGDVKYEDCSSGECAIVSDAPSSAECVSATNTCEITVDEVELASGGYLGFSLQGVTNPSNAEVYAPVEVSIYSAAPLFTAASGASPPQPFTATPLTTPFVNLTTGLASTHSNFLVDFTLPTGLTLDGDVSFVFISPPNYRFGFANATVGIVVDRADGTVLHNCTGYVPQIGHRLEGVTYACDLKGDAAETIADETDVRWIVYGVRSPSVAEFIEGLSVYVVTPESAGPMQILAGAAGVDGPTLVARPLTGVKVTAINPEKAESTTLEISFVTPIDVAASDAFKLVFPDISNSDAMGDIGYELEKDGCFFKGGGSCEDFVTNDATRLLQDMAYKPMFTGDMDVAKYSCDEEIENCKGVLLDTDNGNAYFYVAAIPDPPAADGVASQSGPEADTGRWRVAKKIIAGPAEINANKFKFDKISSAGAAVAGVSGALKVAFHDDTEPVLVWTRVASATSAPAVIPSGTKVTIKVSGVQNPGLEGYTGDFPRFEIVTPSLDTVASAESLPGITLRSTPADAVKGKPHGDIVSSKFRIKTLNLEGNEFRIAEWRIDFAQNLFIDGKPITSLTELVKLEGDTVPEITTKAQGAAHLWCRSGTAPYETVRNVPSWPCTTCPKDSNKRPPVDENALLEEASKRMWGDAGTGYTEESGVPTDEDLDFDPMTIANGGGGGGPQGNTPDTGYSKCKRDAPPKPPGVTVQYPPTRMLLVVPPYDEPTLGLLPAFGGSVLGGQAMLPNRLNLVMILTAHAPPNAKEKFFEDEFFESCSVLIPGHGKGQRFKVDPAGNYMKDGSHTKAPAKITDSAGRAINVRLYLERDALDKAAGNPFDSIPPWQSTDCNYTNFVALSENIASVVQEMDSAVGLYQSRAVRTLLTSLTATEHYLTCTKLVDSLVTDTIDRRTAVVGDSTACFVTDTQSQAWKEDPCCNKKLSATMCCAPRDITVSYLANAEPFYLNIEKQCNLDLYCDLANRWLPSYVADKEEMIENPATGCAAVRASLVTDELWDSLRQFENSCMKRIFGPDGWSGARCTKDSDCFTGCHYDDPNASSGKCRVPQGPAGISLLAECFVENMTPLVRSKLGEMWGVEVPDLSAADATLDLTSAFYAKFEAEVSSDDCVGPKACGLQRGFAGSGLTSTGEWKVTVKAPDEANCAAVKECNWDPSVKDPAVCANPPGKGTHFCRACDGPFCLSLENMGVTTQNKCEANGSEYCFGLDCEEFAECTAYCGTDEWGSDVWCENEAQCLSQGNATCSDEDLSTFSETTYEFTPAACWAPPRANDITGFPESCLSTEWSDTETVWSWPDSSGFGCIFSDYESESACLNSPIEGARWIHRASNRTACVGDPDAGLPAQVEACWDDALQTWTLHGRDECLSCGREWKSPYEWVEPEWLRSKGFGTKWMQRAYAPVNAIVASLDLNKVKGVVDDLVDATIGGFFSSEAKCRVSLINVQKNIVCACAAGNADRASECTASIRQELGSTYINKESAESGKGVGARDQARGSSIGAVTSSMDASNPNLGIEKKINPANAHALCTDTARRAGVVRDARERSRFEALRRPSLDQSSFNLIADSAGNIVGQLLGSGLDVTTAGTGDLSVCLETSSSITQSDAYTQLAYSGADASGNPSSVVTTAVTRNTEGKVCGTLSASGTYFPVAYDPSYTPPTPVPTPVPESSQQVNVTISGTAAAFNSTLQAAFLASLADASKAPLAALAISSVTDVNDTATRRALNLRAGRAVITRHAHSGLHSGLHSGFGDGGDGAGAVHPRLAALATASRIRILLEVKPTSTMTAETAATLVRATVSNPSSPLVAQYGLVPSTDAQVSVAPPEPPQSLNVTLRRELSSFTAAEQTSFAAAVATRLGIASKDVVVTSVTATTVPALATTATKKSTQRVVSNGGTVVRAGATDPAVIVTLQISDSETAGGFVIRASFARDMLALIANDGSDALTAKWNIVTSAQGGSTALPATPTPVPSPSATPTSAFVPYDPVSTSAEFDLIKPNAAARGAAPALAAVAAAAAALMIVVVG